ncbi:protein gustavus isoform X4 [Vespula squamosa]|uniref:Protein gustavus isoform X4 n=1 Tax=Vespula squamosa TaxID=30214 RepID=A0ABD2BYW5_VESSQ
MDWAVKARRTLDRFVASKNEDTRYRQLTVQRAKRAFSSLIRIVKSWFVKRLEFEITKNI